MVESVSRLEGFSGRGSVPGNGRVPVRVVIPHKMTLRALKMVIRTRKLILRCVELMVLMTAAEGWMILYPADVGRMKE